LCKSRRSRDFGFVRRFKSDRLLGDQQSKYLFVSARSVGIWAGMSARIFTITRRYIPGCPGFSAHAFRHLVATDWLTHFPNDYVTVAQLLNDKLETVMAHYAHLRRDTSFQRYEEHLNAMHAPPVPI
jgi:integrase